MGILGRLLGGSEDDEPTPTHQCRACKDTFEGERVACPSCGGTIVSIEE